MSEIIKIDFQDGELTKHVRDKNIYQWSYGHTLQVEGVTLPDGNIEVHFSLTDYDGEAPAYIGYVKNNVLTVEIPDFILQKENVYAATYEAYAWIYFTDGDFGKTMRKIVFTIEARSEPTAGIPEDKKEPFLDEVRKIMNETKEVAQSVRDDADAGKFNGKDGKDGKDGESGTGEIDEEQLLKFAIKSTTDPSPFHHITDSANYRVLDFGMEGVTEQKQYEGKNWFDLANAEIKKQYGIKDDTGEVYWYGNGNAIVNFTKILPNTEYVVYVKQINYPYGSVKLYFYDSEKNYLGKDTRVSTGNNTLIPYEAVAFTTPENAHYCRMWYSSNDINTLQIELGTEVTDFEQYVGSTPSPNPYYQQEIVNAGVLNEETGRYEHKCKFLGGNLINLNQDYYEGYADMVPIVNDDEICITIPRAYNAQRYCIDVPPYTNLILSVGDIDRNGIYIQVSNYKFDGTSINSRLAGGNTSATLYTAEHSKLIVSLYVSEVTGTFRLKKLSLNVETKSDWQPHASQPLTLTSDRPLTKWDKLVKRDGVLGWSIWSIVQTFDGTENWQAYGQFTSFYLSLGHRLVNDNGMCTHYSLGNFRNTNQVFGTNSSDIVWIRDERFYNGTDVSEFKAWLAENNVTVALQTSSEVAFIPLPDEEQTLLNNLETYYGVTNVYNEQGCPMWLTYVNDTKLYVDKKLLEIQQAMI